MDSDVSTGSEGRQRAMIATFVMMGASAILLVVQLANARTGADALFDIAFCAIGIGIQIRMLQKINRYWDDMDRSDRIRTTAIAILAPILVFLGVFVLVLFVAFWFVGSVLPRLLGQGGRPSSGGGPILRAIFSSSAPSVTKDQYGNRTGSIEPDGTVKDQYGNRTGSIDHDGTTKDQYGNRTGSVDLDNGTMKDRYGNPRGSIGHDGVMKDRYGNRTGSME
jgi:hypothetical protein